MKTQHEEGLALLRHTWEGGLVIVSKFWVGSRDCLIVVAKGTKEPSIGRYFVLRYFVIAGGWQVSVDAQDVSADGAFMEIQRVLD